MKPVTYTVKQVQLMLSISRTAAYTLMNDPPFPVIRIGKAIRIPKELFDKWLLEA